MAGCATRCWTVDTDARSHVTRASVEQMESNVKLSVEDSDRYAHTSTHHHATVHHRATKATHVRLSLLQHANAAHKSRECVAVHLFLTRTPNKMITWSAGAAA